MQTVFNKLLKKYSSQIIDTSSNTIVIAPPEINYVYKSFGAVVPMSQISHKDSITFEANTCRTKSNYLQLCSLSKSGINTLDDISISKDSSTIKMTKIEFPILSDLITENKVTKLQFIQLGKELVYIHSRLKDLKTNDILEFEIDERFNAHCARNFKYKTAGWLTGNDSRKLQKSELEDVFEEDIKNALETLDKHKHYTGQSTIIYGDFKPDNIFAKSNDMFVFIDPLISLGRKSCDIAKFGSRTLLLNQFCYTYFLNFVDSYLNSSINIVSKEEIAHMIAFDLLNYFSKLLILSKKGILSRDINSKDNILILKDLVPKFLKGNLNL